ncbi:MAG: hypothetical protein ACTHK1_06965 [Actinomycetales bacterium]
MVEQAVRAQFGSGFRQFGALRRRRNELEYPQRADDEANEVEAATAVANAREILIAAERLLSQLGLF